MRRSFLAMMMLAAASAAPLYGQTSDAAWQDRCERDSDRNDRETHCEVRVSGFRPGRGGFHFEPGSNGGVRVEGWDRDGVSVHARIRASAVSFNEARSLVREVSIERSGQTIRR